MQESIFLLFLFVILGIVYFSHFISKYKLMTFLIGLIIPVTLYISYLFDLSLPNLLIFLLSHLLFGFIIAYILMNIRLRKIEEIYQII